MIYEIHGKQGTIYKRNFADYFKDRKPERSAGIFSCGIKRTNFQNSNNLN